MIHALVLALSVMGTSDALSKLSVDGFTVSVPSSWKSTEDEGSRTWEDPSGDEGMRAKLELTLWNLAPRKADECVAQVQQKLESDSAPRSPDGGVGAPTVHFDHVKLGGQPAIRSVVFDYVSQGGQAEAAKVEKNKVSTVTYVGCNGTTRFLLTMTSPAAKSPRFGALLKKIAESVQYSGK